MNPTRCGAHNALRIGAVCFVLTQVLSACSRQPVHGPDKQFSGTAVGAMEGAGAGAVMGFQMGVATGPGAAIGAGFGAAAGAIQGALRDSTEELEMETSKTLALESRRSVAQQLLTDHYRRRMAIHPSRDIYPADLFFDGDSARVSPRGAGVLEEVARLNKQRLPYSRLIVAAYAKSVGGEESSYIQHLTDRRSRAVVNQLIKAGIEPRRLETRSVIIDGPLVIDPQSDPTRFNQAIEIIPIDR
jgi:outer membrane protein OmpA-like peptidoglycan-associated protein